MRSLLATSSGRASLSALIIQHSNYNAISVFGCDLEQLDGLGDRKILIRCSNTPKFFGLFPPAI